MTQHIDYASAAISSLGATANETTPLGVLGPFGQWLGWPDWMVCGTSLNAGEAIPQSISMRDDLRITANILDRGFGKRLIDQTVESKRLVSGPNAALLVRNAPSLGEALRSLSALVSATNPCFEIHRSANKDCTTLWFSQRVAMGGLLDFYAAIRVVLLVRTIERFQAVDFRDCQLRLTIEQADAGSKIVSEWGESISFAEDTNELIFPREWEQFANPDYDLSLWRLALANLRSFERQSPNTDLAMKLRMHIFSMLETEQRVPRLKEIASLENMSVRTINRRLVDAGITFQEIVDEARRSLISEMIADPTLALASITKAAGYPSLSTFGRSFKAWFGQSPGRYREKLLRGR